MSEGFTEKYPITSTIMVLFIGALAGYMAAGITSEGSSCQATPEDQELIITQYENMMGKDTIEIARIGENEGYTVCERVENFSEMPDVLGSYDCTNLESKTHPMIRKALRQEFGQ